VLHSISCLNAAVRNLQRRRNGLFSTDRRVRRLWKTLFCSSFLRSNYTTGQNRQIVWGGSRFEWQTVSIRWLSVRRYGASVQWREDPPM